MAECRRCKRYTEHLWEGGLCLDCYMGVGYKHKAEPDKEDTKLDLFVK